MATTDDTEGSALADAAHVRAEFEDSLVKLQTEADRFASLDHSPDNLDELLAERARLDDQRAATRLTKKRVALRYEPPVPDHVDAPSGTDDTGARGKVMASIGVAAMVGVLIAAFFAGRAFWGSNFPAEVTLVDAQVVTTDAGSCRWRPTFLVENLDTTPQRVSSVNAVIDRAQRSTVLNPSVVIPPGGAAHIEASIPFAGDGGCPSVDDLHVAVARVFIEGQEISNAVKASLG